MRFSRLSLSLTVTREAEGARFIGRVVSDDPSRPGSVSCYLAWRIGSVESGLKRQKGAASGDSMDAHLRQNVSAAWAIVEVRQASDAVVERFGIVLEDGVPNEAVASSLEPLPTDLHALCYIASHGDLISSLGANAVAGRAHYRDFGVAEGRNLSFRPYEYAASHTDLFHLVTDPEAATRHFITNGFDEGRPIYFDAYLYGAGYPDIAHKYGSDVAALTLHYVQHGHSHGFHCDGFDWKSYIDKTPSAPRTRSGAAEHFLNTIQS